MIDKVATLTARVAELEKIIAARDQQLTDEIAMSSKFGRQVLKYGSRIRVLEQALRPFADAVKKSGGWSHCMDNAYIDPPGDTLTFGDLRRAAATLTQGDPNG